MLVDEKVLKRLSLLNKHYPLKGKNCDNEEINKRLFEYGVKKSISNSENGNNDSITLNKFNSNRN